MGFREELQKRVEKKRSEISALAGKLKEAEIYAQALEDTLKLLPKEDGGVSEAPAEIPLREGSNIAKAKEAIQKAGKPMHITELLAALGKPADKDARAALAGSLGAYVPHRQRSVQPLFDPHVGSTQPADDRRPVVLIHLGIEADGVIVPHLSRFHMAQGGRQIVALVQRTVRIVGVGRLHRQLPLPPHHILLFQVLVRLFEGLHARYPHPFHQAIL